MARWPPSPLQRPAPPKIATLRRFAAAWKQTRQEASSGDRQWRVLELLARVEAETRGVYTTETILSRSWSDKMNGVKTL